MREIEAPNHLLHLFEMRIDLALLNGATHSSEDWNGNPAESMTEMIISELLNDETTPQLYKTAESWMGETVHGRDGERMETMLAGQNIL